ncbi:hypothetical protein PG993_012262 [Apiospora rasikravindrae]|uniref:Uncharacterized protein n=1 Tax=Apiospora rasikravindrae TaxID=990691 RepID=A0ABR1S212_9PEZI
MLHSLLYRNSQSYSVAARRNTEMSSLLGDGADSKPLPGSLTRAVRDVTFASEGDVGGSRSAQQQQQQPQLIDPEPSADVRRMPERRVVNGERGGPSKTPLTPFKS